MIQALTLSSISSPFEISCDKLKLEGFNCTTTEFQMPTKAEAQIRHSRYFLRVLRIADNLYVEGKDSMTLGLNLFDIESRNISSGREWVTTQAPHSKQAAQFCSSYPGVGAFIIDLRLNPTERINWLEDALIAAQYLGNKEAEGRHCGALAGCYADLGMFPRAIKLYERRLAIAQELGDKRGEGAALGNLGNVYADLKQLQRAADFYQQHLIIAREIGDRRAEANALGNLGNIHADKGNPDQALELYELAITISREIGDRRG